MELGRHWLQLPSDVVFETITLEKPPRHIKRDEAGFLLLICVSDPGFSETRLNQGGVTYLFREWYGKVRIRGGSGSTLMLLF